MITSTKNSRIVQARKLSQRKHRLRQNRFLVEGLQLLGMAAEMMTDPVMGSKIVPGELFYSEPLFTGETAPRLLAQLAEAGAQPVAVAPHVLDTLSERDSSQGLAATFALQEMEWTVEDLKPVIALTPEGGLSSLVPTLLLVLDQLQDPGNLGTLIRTADAVNARAVILLEPAVDPFDPKTVRGTMGSLFTVPLLRTDQAGNLLAFLSDAGYQLVGADVGRGAPPWQAERLTGPTALVLGNEARGLSPELYTRMTGYVSLPLLGRAESLNVAIAGGVLMYEWLRINRS